MQEHAVISRPKESWDGALSQMPACWFTENASAVGYSQLQTGSTIRFSEFGASTTRTEAQEQSALSGNLAVDDVQ